MLPLDRIDLLSAEERERVERWGQGGWTPEPAEGWLLVQELQAGRARGVAALGADGARLRANGPEWLDPLELWHIVQRREITVLVTSAETAAHLDDVVELLGPLSSLRHVVCVGTTPDLPHLGQTCSMSAFLPWQAGGDSGLWTDLGEAFSMTTTHRIGRPAGPRRVAVRDDWGQPVPVGVIGRITLGDGEAAGRWIESGRRGRWLEDGRLEMGMDASAERSSPPRGPVRTDEAELAGSRFVGEQDELKNVLT